MFLASTSVIFFFFFQIQFNSEAEGVLTVVENQQRREDSVVDWLGVVVWMKAITSDSYCRLLIDGGCQEARARLVNLFLKLFHA